MQPKLTDPSEYLRILGQSGDGPYDIAQAALMLASLDHAGRPLAPYRAHLDEIAAVARDELRTHGDVEDAARTLAEVIVGRFGYCGDRLTYEDPQNADLIAVIDRRRGLPVALGILYIHAARAANFLAHGLNTPGHFLLRIVAKDGTVLIDPFNGGALIDRERLRLVPGIAVDPEEPASFGQSVSDADVLLRLANNVKLRALKAGDRARALEIAERMVLLAPARAKLWIDLARLHEADGALGAAKRAYDACLDLAKPGAPLHNDAALGLAGLKRRLN